MVKYNSRVQSSTLPPEMLKCHPRMRLFGHHLLFLLRTMTIMCSAKSGTIIGQFVKIVDPTESGEESYMLFV